MGKSMQEEYKTIENRSYIIGREGHIYINDPTVGKQHAELRIADGQIYLRDLKSTNGTYLLKDQSLVPFDEGFVDIHQVVVLGKKNYSVRQLLSIAGEFAF